MNQDILYLPCSDRENKTDFGLWWLFNQAPHFKTAKLLYVNGSLDKLKSVRERFVNKLKNVGIGFFEDGSDVRVLIDNGEWANFKFIQPNPDVLCGCSVGAAVFDDMDDWEGDIQEFVKQVNYTMTVPVNSQIIAFVNKSENIKIHYDTGEIRYRDENDKVKFVLSRNVWDIRRFFTNFDN